MSAQRIRREPRVDPDEQRAEAGHRPLGGPASITALQRTVGNAAVVEMLAIQRCGATPADQCGCHAGESERDPATGGS
jgi:hypothetical protein